LAATEITLALFIGVTVGEDTPVLAEVPHQHVIVDGADAARLVALVMDVVEAIPDGGIPGPGRVGAGDAAE